jgi:hypothetical protein
MDPLSLTLTLGRRLTLISLQALLLKNEYQSSNLTSFVPSTQKLEDSLEMLNHTKMI